MLQDATRRRNLLGSRASNASSRGGLPGGFLGGLALDGGAFGRVSLDQGLGGQPMALRLAVGASFLQPEKIGAFADAVVLGRPWSSPL